MKKKTISVILAVVMMFSMCIPAFAVTAAGDAINALEGNQKLLAEFFLVGYNELEESGTAMNISNVRTKYIGTATVAGYVDSIDLSSGYDVPALQANLEGDITAAYAAVFTDANLKYSSSWLNNLVTNSRNLLNAKISDFIILFGSICQSLTSEHEIEMANMLIKILNETDYLPSTEEGRDGIAAYIYENFSDPEGLYALYKEDSNAVTSLADTIVRAVWSDNASSSKLGVYNSVDPEGVSTEGPGSLTAAAIADRFNPEFRDRKIKDSINDTLDKFFPDFTLDDFTDMFGGMGESLNKIISAVSGLLGGIFGGGNDDTPTTTTKPSTADNDDFSNTKTGDVAVYAVASVALVAGLALVLTKKKKEDK